MSKLNKLLISTLCLPLLFSCSNEPNYEWITISSTYKFIQSTNNNIVTPFNTVMTLKYFKDYDNMSYSDTFDQELSNLFIDNVIALHKKLDRHHSYYDEDGKTIITNVKTVNDAYATGEEVYCSEELYNLLKLGHQLTLDTNGYFNFYIGGLTSFWDFILESINEDPSNYLTLDPAFNSGQKEIISNYQNAIVSIDEIENIMTFNDDNKSVIFNAVEDKDGLERSQNTSLYRPYITSGGIAKGYATDILKNILHQNNYYQGFINSGSSSITSLSDLDFTEKGYQNMSVVDPRSGSSFNREVAFTIKLYKDYSLSTSGNYTSDKSYYFIDPTTSKKIYRHHIINPLTGEPSLHHASVTLISNTFTNGELDALSTAFVNMPLNEGISFKKTLLELYPNHDLDLIFMDIDPNNALEVTISANENLVDNIIIEAKDCVVSYE